MNGRKAKATRAQQSCALTNMKHIQQSGYIAISSVLVIMVVVLVIGTTVSLLSINDIQGSLSNKKGLEALDLVEGCVEDALLQLHSSNLLSATITIPEGVCTISDISQVGTEWTFTVSGSFNGYTKNMHVSANRQSAVEVTSWMEL